jgi:hypothetical protein
MPRPRLHRAATARQKKIQPPIAEQNFQQAHMVESTLGVQPIPADMRLQISIGMPNFEMPNLDSVNQCTSKEISMEIWQSTIQKKLRKLFLIDGEAKEQRAPGHSSGHDPWAGRVLETQTLVLFDALLRSAVLAARFSPRWCHWFLIALSPCADSTKDTSGCRCADVFTVNGCGQQGAGAARALLLRRAVCGMVQLVDRTLAIWQSTMTHGGVSVSRPGPSSWGKKGHDDSTGTIHPAFMAPCKVGVCCLANVCGCSRTGIRVWQP